MKKILLNILIAFSLVITQVPIAKAEDTITPTITASGQEDGTRPPEFAFDGKNDTRWASQNRTGSHWIQIVYNQKVKVGSIEIDWERSNVNHLIIEGLQGEEWVEIYSRTTNPEEKNETIALDQPYELEGLKIRIENFSPTYDGITWNTVSIFEVRTNESGYKAVVSEGNLMLGQSVEVSNYESGTNFTGANIVDGNLGSRWATNQNVTNPTATVTLDKVYTIQSFKIFWDERLTNQVPDPNIESYKIEYSMDGETWETAHARTEYLATTVEQINLDEAIQAKYVRLVVLQYRLGAHGWKNVGVREFEAYSYPQAQEEYKTLSDVYALFLNDDGTQVVLPKVLDAASVSIEGTDAPGVIDLDGHVTSPLQDKEVEISLISYKEDGQEETKAFKIKVKGQYENQGTGTKPIITPNIQEWYGLGETLIIQSYKLDFTKAEAFKRVGEIYTQDLKELGKNVSDDASSTPVVFEQVTFGKGADEAYLIEINTDKIVVKAQAYVGALHATRTLLQVDDANLSTGIIRDYPSFGMRSFMLDVGRKFVPYEELVELMKNLAFYKYNDFQLHLNDNFIWLSDHKVEEFESEEAYLKYVLDNAETGFRLDVTTENNGVKLTSDDHYTKEEFRNLVKLSQDLGILLVPELDTPGHALSFVKVRPDLMYQGNIGEKDASEKAAMLDLGNDQTLPFIKSVYNELFSDLFKELPVIHIGSDEYYGDNEAYRKYLDDMIQFVETNNKTARVWGSLSNKTGTTPVRSKDVQLDIWNLGWNSESLALNDGFDIINILDDKTYIVPSGDGSRSGYGDYLNNQSVYNSWAPNIFDGKTIPASHPQLLGGSFALWNDLIDLRDVGITSHDMMVRTYDALPYFSEKLWGSKTGLNYEQFNASNMTKFTLAPGTNPFSDLGYEDTVLDLNNVQKEFKTELDEISYRQKGDDLIIDMTLNLNSNDKEQVIASGPRSTIYAVDKDGYFAYQFEKFHIQFDVTLPTDKYVNIKMVLSNQNTRLFVNDEEVERIEHPKYKQLKLTSFVAPLEKLNVTLDGSLDIFNVYYGEYVDQTRITLNDIKTLKASSEETDQSNANDNGQIEKAFDNDLNSLWHSKWKNGPAFPHIVDIEFKNKEVINEFIYVPRRTQTNGMITEYEIDFFNEGEVVYSTKGTWSVDTEDKVIKLDAVSRGDASSNALIVDAIKFSSIRGEAGFSSAAEFIINRGPKQSNKIELNALIKEAKSYTAEELTQESYAQLETALNNAVTISIKSHDQEEIDAAVTALRLALDNLESNPKADNTILLSKIQEAKNYKEEDFTAETYKKLQEAIKFAEEKVDSKNQRKLDQALETLSSAMDDLVAVIKTEKLEQALVDARKYKQENYTVLSFTTLTEAINMAESKLTSETQVEVDEAETTLRNAIMALVDISLLKIELEKIEASTYIKTDYTEASFKRLEDAVAAANDLFEAGTSDKVNTAISNLKSAVVNLVNISSLKETLDEAQNVVKDHNTEESYNTFEDAFAIAKEALESDNQKTVDGALNNLKLAINNLIDISGLKDKVKVIRDKAYDATHYTNTSFEKLETAIAYAESLYTKGTKDEIESAMIKLTAAEGSLVNIEALNTLINQALEVQKEAYTSSSFESLQHAIQSAKEAQTAETQLEVSMAISSLKEALESLVKLADMSDLIALIQKAEAIEGSNYTPTSYNNLQDKIQEAKTLLDSGDQNEVSLGVQALQDAIDSLINIEALKNIIIDAEAIHEGYTSTSLEALKTAIATAKESLDATSKEQVEQAIIKLQTVMEALEALGNIDNLVAKLEEAKALKEENYTTTSFNTLKAIIIKAEGALKDSSQDTIDNAIIELETAIKGLIDISSLKAKIQKATALKTENYVSTSYKALLSAIDKAESKLDVTTQGEVTQAVADLDAVMKALVKLGDPTELIVKLDEAKALKEENYTTTSFNTLKAIIIKAEGALKDSSQDTIDNAIIELETAIKGLIDISSLKAKINEARALEAEDYVSSSYKALQSAIDKAESKLDVTTQGEVTQAVADLDAVMKALVKLGDPTELIVKLDEAKALKEENYTEASFGKLQDAITIAESALEDASKETIDNAITEIETAIKGLIDISSLKAKIKEATALKEVNYTITSFSTLQEAVVNAQALLESDNQQAVNEEVDKLNKALDNLVDVSSLKAKIENIHSKGYEETNFTEASYKALKDAINSAEALYENGTVSEVTDAIVKLTNAEGGLIRIRELIDLIAEAEKVQSETYTSSSFADLQLAIQTAKEALTAENQVNVSKAISELKSVLDALVPLADMTELKAIIAVAKGEESNKEDYTATSYSKLLQAIDASEQLLDSGDQEAVSKGVKSLQDAIDGLINITSLKAKINEARALEAEDYVSSSYTELQSAIEKAESKLDVTTQDEVTQAVADLDAVMKSLVKLGDTSDLKVKLEEAKALQEGNYTITSFGKIKDAISKAESALEDASQETIDNSITELETAIEGLIDISSLKAKIKEATALESEDYVSTSYKALQSAIDKAETKLDVTTQDEVTQAVADLDAVMKSLVKLGDTSDLKVKLEEAKALKEGNYTITSFGKLKDAISKAEGVLEDSSQETIDNAINELETAIKGLIDISSLKDKINEARALKAEDYVSSSYTELQSAIEIAETQLDFATQDEVTQAVADLDAVMIALVKLGDTSNLKVRLEEAKALQEGNYTITSFGKFKDAISKAEGALEDSSQETIDNAINELETAIKGLIDISSLKDKINEARALKAEDYVSSSYTELQSAIEIAESQLDVATQDEVTQAVSDLDVVMKALVKLGDPSNLKVKLEEAKALKEEYYTEASFNTLEEAITKSEGALEDSSQETINNAINELETAIKGLIDISSLKAKIKEAKVLKAEDYVSTSYKALQSAIDKAESKLDVTTQDEVTQAVADLDAVMIALVKLGDTSNLKVRLEEAQAYEEGNYTITSFGKLKDAITIAESALEDASQEAIDNAIAKLETAIENLVETTELNQVIEKAESYKSEDYTEVSFNNLLKAIDNAKAVIGNESSTSSEQQEVDEALANLQDAIENLVYVGELKEVINSTELIVGDGYTSASYEALQQAITRMKEALLAENQDSVDQAIIELEAAVKALVALADTKVLEDKIAEAEVYESEHYTEDSYKQLQEAIAQAKELLVDTDQNTVDAAIENLQTAIDALVEKELIVPDEKPNGEDSDIDKPIEEDSNLTKPKNPETIKPEDKDEDALPLTGMGMNYTPYFLIAFGGLFFAMSKRYKKEE